MVLTASKVPGPWRIGANGIPTRGTPAMRAQLRAYGGRYNRRAGRNFWRGKDFDIVLGTFRDVAVGRPVRDIIGEAGSSRCRGRAPPAPAPPAPPAPALVPIPPEQAAIAQDNNPDDTSGLLAALAPSADKAAAAVALEAAYRTAALAAAEARQAQEDHDLWASDDDDEGGDGGMAPVVDLTSSSDVKFIFRSKLYSEWFMWKKNTLMFDFMMY